jgi:hypothetical protein
MTIKNHSFLEKKRITLSNLSRPRFEGYYWEMDKCMSRFTKKYQLAELVSWVKLQTYVLEHFNVDPILNIEYSGSTKNQFPRISDT